MTLADTMAAAGSPIRDDELIDHILTGLGSAYNSIAASLGVSNAPMPYSSFYLLVLSFEALQAQQSAEEGWSPSANAVTRSAPTAMADAHPTRSPTPPRVGVARPMATASPGMAAKAAMAAPTVAATATPPMPAMVGKVAGVTTATTVVLAVATIAGAHDVTNLQKLRA